VLMTNHVHLLATPQNADSISRLIQYVGRHYVTYVRCTRFHGHPD
jgi:putative transposase